MSDWIFENFGWVVFGLVVAMLVACFQLAKATCYSQWGHSGLEADWGPIKGCVVQTPNGRWLPADSLRDMDLNPRE